MNKIDLSGSNMEKITKRKTIIEGNYRYCLWREWDVTNPSYTLFILLNPSTADDVNDDPTIRRCEDYARRWRDGAVCVVNLFAYRATKPTEMKKAARNIKNLNIVGDKNNHHLRNLAKSARIIIAAWGVHGTYQKRDKTVKDLMKRHAKKLHCLKLTKKRHPAHPLYLKRTLEPFLFVY